MAAHGRQFTKINLSCLLDFFTHTHTQNVDARAHTQHTRTCTRAYTHMRALAQMGNYTRKKLTLGHMCCLFVE